MAQRDIKRFIFVIVYLLLISLISLALYFIFKDDPSCFDNKKNQGESGVDCGGPCIPCPEITRLEPLQLKSIEWVHDVEKKFDILAKVTNPNDVFGASKVMYRAQIIGTNSEIIDESSWQSGFVLPGETKYLLVQSFETNALPVDNVNSKVSFEIDQADISWERFKDFEAPNLVINNSRYEQVTGGEV